MADDKVVFDRLVIADEQGHLTGKPAEGIQQQIEQALAPMEKIPAGGAQGEVLARASNDGTQLTWRTVRDGVDGRNGRDGVDGQPGRDGTDGAPGRDGLDGRGISRIEPTPGGASVNVFMNDGSVTEVPVHVTAEWSLEAQAKAQGYIIVTGETPPTEDTMYGVPVYWLQGSALTPPTPVQAPTPSTNLAKRTLTFPERIGVQYFVDEQPVPPGDFVVPGTDRKTVKIEAKPSSDKFVFTGTYRWMRTFGSITDRVLVASDSFTGRAAGTLIVPPVEESQRATWGDFKNKEGAAWNNAAGGSRPMVWNQSGSGVWLNGGVVTPSSWEVTERGAIMPRRKALEGGMVFPTGTPNVSFEFDISAVSKNVTFCCEFGQPKVTHNSRGVPAEIWLSPGQATVRDRASDGTQGPAITAGSPAGTWRFDFLDGVITITSPSGIQVVRDHSPLTPSQYGAWSKIWVSEPDSMEISGIRRYQHPND